MAVVEASTVESSVTTVVVPISTALQYVGTKPVSQMLATLQELETTLVTF
jgi:hypothetical protein